MVAESISEVHFLIFRSKNRVLSKKKNQIKKNPKIVAFGSKIGLFGKNPFFWSTNQKLDFLIEKSENGPQKSIQQPPFV